MENSPNEEMKELLRRIKQGDASAFQRLIDIKSKSLQKLAFRYLGDTMLAEDVVSDTFYELIKNHAKFKSDKNLNGWLNVVVIHKSLNVLKKRARESLVDDDSIYAEAAPSNLTEQIHIRDCLNRLEVDERSAVLYKYYGYTLKETAQMMNLTIRQLRDLLCRAEKKFKNFYES